MFSKISYPQIWVFYDNSPKRNAFETASVILTQFILVRIDLAWVFTVSLDRWRYSEIFFIVIPLEIIVKHCSTLGVSWDSVFLTAFRIITLFLNS